MSALELFAMAEELGIGKDEVISFQYKLQDHGWKKIISDVDALEMGLIVDSSKVNDLYVKENSVDVNIHSQVQSNVVSSTFEHEVDVVDGYCANSNSSELYSLDEETDSENGTDGSYQLSNDSSVEDDDALYEVVVDPEVEFAGIRNEDEQGTGEGQSEATLKDNIEEGESSMQIKALRKKHHCNRAWKVSKLNSAWIAKSYNHRIITNPTWPTQSLLETIQQKTTIKVNKQAIYRAMKKSASMIEGSDDEQYAMLWDYCQEMKQTNPGSTVVMKTTPVGDGSGLFRFKRIYICFEDLNKCFSKHCRLVIGLDGCHLIGPRSGILLIVVGRDGNNQMYPVAYAVVEAERAKT
ncbi:hypothetical protein MRB53_019722 [Persea americana]|uniref:Uncharacterized protein n=1 Tax=Persea americana TaxID=3435 RepID=A0ACC2KYZ6_PERAE|nr:hypothetical protein MRB53_019722 [Persea americana]